MKSSKNGKSTANIILKHFTKFEEIMMIAESTVRKNNFRSSLATSGLFSGHFCSDWNF